MMYGPPSTDGYSLLELLVVLAIAALIAVIAVPAVGGSLERMTLASDARALTTELRRLRERALDDQTDVSLAASGSAGNLLVTSGGETLSLADGTRIEILSTSGAPATPRFTIAWDGSMTGAVRLTRGGSSARIVADKLTGRLSVETGR